MGIKHNEVNFEVECEGHQIGTKMLKEHLRVLMTIICDLKIDLNMSEPHYVISSSTVKLFDF